MRQIERLSLLITVLAVGAMLAGCGETAQRQAVVVNMPIPMTTDEVAAAAQEGESESALLSQLEERGYASALTTKDVDQLRSDGVPEPVIDWMLAHPTSTLIRSVPVREVVYVERPPRTSSTIGVTYGSDSSHRRRSHRCRDKRDRDEERDDDSPRTRTIKGKNGRVYRFTSGG